jgi:hypothetical protein
MERELWKRCVSLCGSSMGETAGRAPLLGTPKDKRSKALEKVRLPLWEFYERQLQGGFLYWGPRRMYEVRLWKRCVSLCGSSVRENCREGSFTGDPEGYAK